MSKTTTQEPGPRDAMLAEPAGATPLPSTTNVDGVPSRRIWNRILSAFFLLSLILLGIGASSGHIGREEGTLVVKTLLLSNPGLVARDVASGSAAPTSHSIIIIVIIVIIFLLLITLLGLSRLVPEWFTDPHCYFCYCFQAIGCLACFDRVTCGHCPARQRKEEEGESDEQSV